MPRPFVEVAAEQPLERRRSGNPRRADPRALKRERGLDGAHRDARALRDQRRAGLDILGCGRSLLGAPAPVLQSRHRRESKDAATALPGH